MHQSLKTWLQRLDKLYIFTPSRWPHRELISKSTALIIIVIFLGMRGYRFHQFPGTLSDTQIFYSTISAATDEPLYSSIQIMLLWGIKAAVWSIETLIYLGYIVSYASRVQAVAIAKGFMETAFPILVAGTPILISLLPYGLPHWVPYTSHAYPIFYMVIMAMIVIGGLINLIGLLTLRRAFAIMAEARSLVTNGIYGYVRHPLYSGYFIMAFGSLLLKLSWISVGLYLLFFMGQVLRAKIEERKLTANFPEYAEYRNRTGMFFPKQLFRGSKLSTKR